MCWIFERQCPRDCPEGFDVSERLEERTVTES